MIHLKPMSEEAFERFKKESQSAYAANLAAVEVISFDEALKNASDQFNKLVPRGSATPSQSFFDVIETVSGNSIGFLWLDFQTRFGRRVASINDIGIASANRGKGFGKALMKLVEVEAGKAGAVRIRLHVFHHNEVAKKPLPQHGFSTDQLRHAKRLVSYIFTKITY